MLPRRLPSEDDLHRAAVWRLAGWPAEAIQAGQAALMRLVDEGHPLDERGPQLAAVLQRLQAMQPADCRRDAWTAAAALLCLAGESRGDVALFWRSGSVVLQAQLQAARGARPHRQDALDQLIEEHLANHPDRSAPALFAHFKALAPTRVVIVDATDDEIAYDTEGGQLRYVTRQAFAMRVSRIKARRRHGVNGHDERAAA